MISVNGSAGGRPGTPPAGTAFFWAALTLAAAGVALPAAAQMQKPAVDVAAPIVKTVREWDQYTGRFQAVNRVEIRARVSGYLKSIHFGDGQLVKEGDLLFVIDPRPFEADLAAAKAGVESAKAELKLADAELKRGEELLRRKVTAEAEVERRRAQRDIATAKALEAAANARTAELNLSFTNVRAPAGGRVSDRRVDVGNLVSGGSAGATLLTTLVGLDPIHFVFDASERAYLKYARLNASGQGAVSRSGPNPVYVRLADETGWPHRGVMNFVDNELGQETGTIRGRAVLPNPNGFLQPGMFGEVRLLGSRAYPAVLVPDSAILSDQATKIVMAVDAAGKVSARVVEIGPMIDGLRVIRKGLTGEEKIVVNGVQRAGPGAEATATVTEIRAVPDGFDPVPDPAR